MRLRWLMSKQIKPGSFRVNEDTWARLQYEELEPWETEEMRKLGGGRFVWHDIEVVDE